MKKIELTMVEFLYLKDKEETYHEIYYYFNKSRFPRIRDNNIIRFTFCKNKSYYKYRANVFGDKIIFIRSGK